MKSFDVFIEKENQWFKLGTYNAENGNQAMSKAKKDEYDNLLKLFTEDELSNIKLDFQEVK